MRLGRSVGMTVRFVMSNCPVTFKNLETDPPPSQRYSTIPENAGVYTALPANPLEP